MTYSPSSIDGYIKLDGSFAYCDQDSAKKCVDASQTCSSGQGVMACNGNWWWGGYWSGWWYWSYYYGIFGDNMIFLYSEVDAPPEYLCGYPRKCGIATGASSWSWNWGWWNGWYYGQYQYCTEDIGDCNFPRIKNCKTSKCVNSTYSNYWYGWSYVNSACSTINGKDREERCCTKPSNFTCKEGECDYDYEIVKKTYSIEYELVKPSYICHDPPEELESSCENTFSWYYYGWYNGAYIMPDKCYESKEHCSPKNKCPYKSGNTDVYWCDPDANKASNGYEEIADEPTQIIWDYPPKDCDTKCVRCIPCGEDDCTFAWYDNYNWGWWGWNSFSYTIGSDCCDNNNYYWYGNYGRPQICPTTVYDDGSGNPWWCSGTDCVQMEEGDETEGFEGPFTSRSACMKGCNEDTNKCVEPDPTLTTGLCCDKNFMKQVEQATTDSCNKQLDRKTVSVKQKICTGKNCADSAYYKYNKEMCGYETKFAETEKSVHTKSTKIYEYTPEYPKQRFADYEACNGYYNYWWGSYYGQGICNVDQYAKCQADWAAQNGGNDCPSNTTKPLQINKTNFKAQEVVSSATVSLVAVFCKMTTKQCQPSQSEGGGGSEE